MKVCRYSTPKSAWIEPLHIQTYEAYSCEHTCNKIHSHQFKTINQKWSFHLELTTIFIHPYLTFHGLKDWPSSYSYHQPPQPPQPQPQQLFQRRLQPQPQPPNHPHIIFTSKILLCYSILSDLCKGELFRPGNYTL